MKCSKCGSESFTKCDSVLVTPEGCINARVLVDVMKCLLCEETEISDACAADIREMAMDIYYGREVVRPAVPRRSLGLVGSNIGHLQLAIAAMGMGVMSNLIRLSNFDNPKKDPWTLLDDINLGPMMDTMSTSYGLPSRHVLKFNLSDREELSPAQQAAQQAKRESRKLRRQEEKQAKREELARREQQRLESKRKYYESIQAGQVG